MERRSVLALTVLGLAVVLGVVGELLLRAGPWGISAPLAALALAAGFHVLVRRMELPLRGAGRWLWGVIPLLAAVFAWRASPPLLVLAVLGVLVSLVCAALAAHGRALRGAGAWDVVAEGVATALNAGLGVLLLPGAVRWGEIGWRPWNTRTGAVVRGAVLAVPPLVVFGALFVSADEAFARLVGDLVRVDVEEILSHIVLAAFFAWIAGGFLRWLVLDDGSRVPRSEAVGVRLGAVEVGVVLGAVIALFAAFVAVQFTYLFGGEAMVRATTGLTYAEYARSGFFELVVVAGLLLPLLHLALWLVRGAGPRSQRVTRALAAGLVVLVFVILGSALYRMRLYQEAYGLSLDRFYATAFMAWLSVVFLWFTGTELRARPQGFVGGAVATALAAVLLIAALNPEAHIVEANVARARTGAELDAGYFTRELGADAVPALVAALPALPDADRCATAHLLVERWGEGARGRGDGDWRSWSYARSRARGTVREHEATLRRLACPPPARPGPAQAPATAG